MQNELKPVAPAGAVVHREKGFLHNSLLYVHIYMVVVVVVVVVVCVCICVCVHMCVST